MRIRSNSGRTTAWLAVALLAALTLGNCGDDGTEITGPEPPDNSAVVVTEPVLVDLSAQPALLALVAGRRAAFFSSSANAQEEVSFVSYAPGSIPEADSIEVRNLTRDLLVGAPMVDGGVDPIAIPASVGDNLEITVFRQMIIFERTTRPVPDSKPPVVVRTDPPRGRTRVPLNASAVMVFTEPISGVTVTPETIRLLKGDQPLFATFTQSADGITIEVTPDQPLEHATTYTISITTGVRDLAGDALEAEFTSDFTTVAAQLTGEIVFESNRSGSFEIWTMRSDGTDLFQITDEVAGGAATGPAVSPDGRRIAFSLAEPASGDDWDIYVTNVDGTGVTNLTNDPAFDGWRPAWSPDGTKVAFFSDRTGDEEIWVINADGTGAVNLTNSPGSDADPTWSPDGTKIAFLSFRDGNGEIYVMNADGTGQTRLTDEPAREDWPAWSPDGTRIAFDSFRDGSRQIYMMNADGTNVVRLTSTPEGGSAAAWSPDGDRIAFSSDIDFGVDIWLINVDGTGLVNLTDGVCCDFFPSWSP